MRRILIALVAVIITSASIFWACSKDGENEEVKNSTSNIKEKCTEFQEQLGEDATIIGFASFDNPEEIFYTFNFDELVEKTSFLCQQEFGFDVILEDFKILDEETFNPEKEIEFKTSFLIPDSEEGATMWFNLKKHIDESNQIIIYYALPDGGQNGNGGYTANFICEMSRACKKAEGYCVRITKPEIQYCGCMQSKYPNATIGCEMVPVTNSNTNQTFWQKLGSFFGGIINGMVS